MKKIFTAILFILLCEAAGIIGSVFTAGSVSTWYPTLIKPSFNPPSWLFGPVWTLLYALMGIAMYLVWKQGWEQAKVRKSIYFFGIHLVVNTAWSIVFFGQQEIGWAIAVIGLMWLMTAYSIRLFARISEWAAWLLVPYLIWVSFATVLNISIWLLNK